MGGGVEPARCFLLGARRQSSLPWAGDCFVATLLTRKKWKNCSDLEQGKKILSFRAGLPAGWWELAMTMTGGDDGTRSADGTPGRVHGAGQCRVLRHARPVRRLHHRAGDQPGVRRDPWAMGCG